MYPDDILAQKVNAAFWRQRIGDKYSHADVLRKLARAEAKCIKATGKSILDMVVGLAETAE